MPMPLSSAPARASFRGPVPSAATATALAGVLFYLAPLADLPRRARLGRDGGAPLGADRHGGGRREPAARPRRRSSPSRSPRRSALLVHLALLSRPVITPQGQDRRARMVSPWPHRRLGGADRGPLAGLLVLILGYDQESYRESIREILNHSALKELDRDGTLFTEENIAEPLGHDRPCAARRLRHHLAHHHPVQSLDGRADRRCLGARAQALARSACASSFPTRCLLVFAGALAASFLPGLPGLLATGLAGALLFAYVLQGLAVIHVYSHGVPLRGFCSPPSISAFCCLGWVAIIVAIVGLAEPLSACASAPAAGPPPKTTERSDKDRSVEHASHSARAHRAPRTNGRRGQRQGRLRPQLSAAAEARRCAPPKPIASASSASGRSSRRAISS